MSSLPTFGCLTDDAQSRLAGIFSAFVGRKSVSDFKKVCFAEISVGRKYSSALAALVSPRSSADVIQWNQSSLLCHTQVFHRSHAISSPVKIKRHQYRVVSFLYVFHEI